MELAVTLLRYCIQKKSFLIVSKIWLILFISCLFIFNRFQISEESSIHSIFITKSLGKYTHLSLLLLVSRIRTRDITVYSKNYLQHNAYQKMTLTGHQGQTVQSKKAPAHLQPTGNKWPVRFHWTWGLGLS